MRQAMNRGAGGRTNGATAERDRAGAGGTGGLGREARRFLDELLMTASPSGAEQAIQRLIRDRMSGVAETVETDLHGNLILGVNTSKKRRVMLAGHCDQLGFLVKYITDDGYLYLDTLGGHDYGVLPGARLTILGRNGPVDGVIGRKPIHLQSNKEMTEVPPLTRLWVDIGARSGDEAREHVALGDYATVRLGVTELLNGRLAAPGLDNKAGLFVCLEALRRCAERAADLDVAVYVVSTVQEEIGSRGAETAAFALDPEVGIAVDVVNATDDPSLGTPQQQVPCKLGGGPSLSMGPNTNPMAGKLLAEAAGRLGIAQQPAPIGQPAGNDSSSIQTERKGVATASVGIPQRNMHTQVEVCATQDLEDCVRVVLEFVASIREGVDFRPMYFER